MADLAVTPANVIPSAGATIIRNYNFGVAVTGGQLVYLESSSNTWKLVDLNAAVTGNEVATVRGIALVSGGIGQPAAVCIKDPDFTPGCALTNGLTVFGSNNPGGITQADIPTVGAYPVILGVAKSAVKMNLNPTASGAIM